MAFAGALIKEENEHFFSLAQNFYQLLRSGAKEKKILDKESQEKI